MSIDGEHVLNDGLGAVRANVAYRYATFFGMHEVDVICAGRCEPDEPERGRSVEQFTIQFYLVGENQFRIQDPV